MSQIPPLWVRVFLGADRVLSRFTAARLALRDEVMLAWVPPSQRSDICAFLYAPLETYLPGGNRFEAGLFDWEEQALLDPEMPRSGRILVAACGAGRELLALQKRGFHVFGFDPCAPFVRAAKTVLDPARAQVYQASYEAFVHAAQSESGDFHTALSAFAPIDAIIFGWGSFSHVLPEFCRLELLRASKRIAPKACLLLSFSMELEPNPSKGGKGRARDALRSVFRALGAPGPSEDGDHFYPEGGYLANLRKDEIYLLAHKAGYRVAWLNPSPYPHALLVPFEIRA